MQVLLRSSTMANVRSPVADLARRLRLSAQNCAGFLWTLYLFTRDDMLTLLMPTTIYGTIAAPTGAPHHILPRIIWIWINLLEINIANQSLDGEEDAMNKPWRPIPSKRISQSTARTLRWTLLPICFALSCAFRVPKACLLLHIGNICYHDFGLASHWATKSLCNALAYAAFNGGASMVMCDKSVVSDTFRDTQILNFLLILTTTHAQDFRDVIGDSATGRLTIPLAYPRASRLSMLVLLPAWSFFLCSSREPHLLVSTVVCAFATYVGLRFYFSVGTSEADGAAYRDYNIWLCFLHIVVLPSIADGGSARLLRSPLL
ncbi:UbiA prenyltransferase family-domain-containing protein [Cerioporus squamosus]|nr:UbiA prenyltransferase family-domain-containing protein [Cerioporus squamosus]